ncbi:uncharacterized protein LOC129581712 [Paramacrobiotus metropolitanus]|uniref:uncharacterized protein LOC129581712 n=1 Tax=Paramacrobiotus metropolitanus TaxID=2943436 RepID=UPI00244590F8|nr:uncharacterized protein LOC129581712 [Paramacrobiotus metropolitanus]
MSRVLDMLQKMTGARFYLEQADIPADQQYVWSLMDFGRLLGLSAHSGLHSLVVMTDNIMNVSQLEDALTYAWTPSFEAHKTTATTTIVPRIRILSLLNSNETLLTDVPPQISETTSLTFCVPTPRHASQTPADGAIAINGVITYFLVSHQNGSYTEQEISYFSCLTFAGNKAWTGWLLDQNAPVPGVYRPPVGDHYLIQPEHSFRMYTSQPVHLQQFPRVQQLLAQQLGQDLKGGQSVDVVLWNPDKTGKAISFMVRLLTNGQVVAELDARLSYADAIYTRLEKAYWSGAVVSELPFEFGFYISRHPIF